MLLKKLSMLAAGFAAAALIWNVPKAYAFDERGFIDRCGNRYGYEFLGTTEKGEAKQRFYDDLYERCCEVWSSDRDISDKGPDSPLRFAPDEYGLTFKDLNDVGEIMIDDNHVFYFFDHYETTRSDENGKEIVTFHIYEDYTEGKVRSAAKDDIYRYVCKTAAELDKKDRIFDKVVYLHDKINDNTEYEYMYGLPSWAPHAHNVLGVIQNGSCVCEGYAGCFSLVMNYAGVDCLFAGGLFDGAGSHVWNEVKLDDGKYYFVDCTADDSLEYTPRYCSLARGSKRFNVSHVPFVIEKADQYENFIYIYPLPEASETDFICKGDVNLDGVIDIEDAVLTISYINGDRVLEGDAFWGADLTSDGIIDISAAVHIIGYLSGELLI